MQIRATKKDYKKFKKYKTDINILKDENLSESICMVYVSGESNGDGTHKANLQEWIRGRELIESFLKNGYAKFRKNCPYRVGKCICEKCSLYLIKNNTGDCAHIWTALNF